MHFLQKTQTIQQSLSACEVRRVLFLIHRSRDAPADKTLCFFFLHFLRFLCIYFQVIYITFDKLYIFEPVNMLTEKK